MLNKITMKDVQKAQEEMNVYLTKNKSKTDRNCKCCTARRFKLDLTEPHINELRKKIKPKSTQKTKKHPHN